MIQPETKLKRGGQFRGQEAVLHQGARRLAPQVRFSVGDIIVVSVKEALPNSKVKKGDVMRAVVVRTVKEVGRPDGSYHQVRRQFRRVDQPAERADRHAYLRTRWPANCGPREFMKIVSLAPEVLVARRRTPSNSDGHDDRKATTEVSVYEGTSNINIKKDDRVMVISGKERGKVGKVLKLLPKKDRVVIVEKVNMIKRHTRPGGAAHQRRHHRKRGQSLPYFQCCPGVRSKCTDPDPGRS
jgi:large subunit ribosomal protein L14